MYTNWWPEEWKVHRHWEKIAKGASQGKGRMGFVGGIWERSVVCDLGAARTRQSLPAAFGVGCGRDVCIWCGIMAAPDCLLVLGLRADSLCRFFQTVKTVRLCLYA